MLPTYLYWNTLILDVRYNLNGHCITRCLLVLYPILLGSTPWRIPFPSFLWSFFSADRWAANPGTLIFVRQNTAPFLPSKYSKSWKITTGQSSSLVLHLLSVPGDHGSNPRWKRKFFLFFLGVISWLPFTFKLIHDYAKWSIHVCLSISLKKNSWT